MITVTPGATLNAKYISCTQMSHLQINCQAGLITTRNGAKLPVWQLMELTNGAIAGYSRFSSLTGVAEGLSDNSFLLFREKKDCQI